MSNNFIAPIDGAEMGDYSARMEALRAWLELTQVSQGTLADEIGVTRQTVNNWLTGRTHPGGIELRKLSERTRIPVDALVPKETD